MISRRLLFALLFGAGTCAVGYFSRPVVEKGDNREFPEFQPAAAAAGPLPPGVAAGNLTASRIDMVDPVSGRLAFAFLVEKEKGWIVVNVGGGKSKRLDINALANRVAMGERVDVDLAMFVDGPMIAKAGDKTECKCGDDCACIDGRVDPACTCPKGSCKCAIVLKPAKRFEPP